MPLEITLTAGVDKLGWGVTDELFHLIIVNDLSGDQEVGNYDWSLAENDGFDHLRGKLVNFDRSRGALALAAEVLAMVDELQNPPGPVKIVELDDGSVEVRAR